MERLETNLRLDVYATAAHVKPISVHGQTDGFDIGHRGQFETHMGTVPYWKCTENGQHLVLKTL